MTAAATAITLCRRSTLRFCALLEARRSLGAGAGRDGRRRLLRRGPRLTRPLGHGHPRKLGDLDAAQIKQVLHGSGLTSSALNDSIALGSEVQVSRQARSKWQDFQRGGWGAADKGVMDLAEREKIDRAETILKFGVKAAEEDELL